jgi:hypothetical protein
MLARYGGAFGTSVAIHAALTAWLAWTGSVSLPARRQRPIQVVLLPPLEDSQFPGVKPVDRADPGWKTQDVSKEGRLGGADVDRIGAHLAVLFPFLTPGLALDAFFPGSPASRMTFENPYARTGKQQPHKPGRHLALTPAQIQAAVDQSWTRARRWDAFQDIRAMCDIYDADDEGLASLLASYRNQNALQPYADGDIRDLRLWAQLGLAADHVTFIGFIRDYTVAHPRTRGATELLLLLDTIAEANEDALAVLVETNQPGDLDWTRDTHPRAYLLARQINRQYTRELVRLGLTTRAAVEEYYERARLELLTRVLATTPNGYRANDARFLIGSILWKQLKRDEALRAWRGLAARADADAGYAMAIGQLRTALASPRPDTRDIDHILRNQQSRWLAASDDRLRHFGYSADSY